jgi:hypothetical protein
MNKVVNSAFSERPELGPEIPFQGTPEKTLRRTVFTWTPGDGMNGFSEWIPGHDALPCSWPGRGMMDADGFNRCGGIGCFQWCPQEP